MVPRKTGPRGLWLAGLGVMAVGLAVPGGCSDRVEPGLLEGQDCLVIVLDALSADHLGCHGGHPEASPALDGLAADGVRFEHAWSQSSWTLASTASLMTGLYQETHAVVDKDRVLPEAAATLAEAFRDRGYECVGFSQNLFASPTYGMGQGFTRFESLVVDASVERDATMAAMVADALADPTSRPPRFVYAHFRRPHAPYDPPAETLALFETEPYVGTITGTPEDIRRHNSGRQRMTAADLTHLRALYDAGIRTVDDEVGRLLARIDTSRTLVVVLSDHGDAFAQHGYLGHNFTSYEEMVHVPFIVAHPSLSGGRVVESPVMSVDLVPTLSEYFGLGFDTDHLPGRSLVPELQGAPGGPRQVFTSSRAHRADQQFALFDGRFKLLVTPDRKQQMLFDLVEDPEETRDLTPTHGAEVQRLRAGLDRVLANQSPMQQASADDLSPEQREAMEALGYFGGRGGAVGHAGPGDPDDPDDPDDEPDDDDDEGR